MNIKKKIEKYSGKLNKKHKKLAIILAAGHGKRIKSEKSKMLHEIWGKSTIKRVADAVSKGLGTDNIVFVLGIKADEVLNAIDKKENYIFVYQEEQLGTGHAVKVAFTHPEIKNFEGDIYIFPGDIGLLTPNTVKEFSDFFEKSDDDMCVLTAKYKGEPLYNYYGRIVRYKDKSDKDFYNKVIAIKEYKDIIKAPEDALFEYEYHGRKIIFSREDLLNLTEFNTGIYAFKSQNLPEYLKEIKDNNVQKEIYLTDLIEIYNRNGLKVGAYSIDDESDVLGFNVKSVLKYMEHLYREKVYDMLKDIILIEDSEHFYIADEVVEQIIKLDKERGPLDIVIGINAYIGKDVVLNKKSYIGNNVMLTGKIILGENVYIGENSLFSNYEGQTIKISDNCHFVGNARIKGEVEIGENCRIESGVRITGSTEYPVKIGKNVTIKGITYIFGSVIEDKILIEHSVIKQKYVEAVKKKNNQIQAIRYILPLPEGMDSLQDL